MTAGPSFSVSARAPDRPYTGFTLVELLVVMGILVLLIALVVPAVGTILGGTELNRAGQMVSDNLALARQEAVKANREVYVLFYKVNDSGQAAWRGIQIAYLDRTVTPIAVTPIGKIDLLPGGVEIFDASYGQGLPVGSYAPLLSQYTVSGTRNVGADQNVPWQGFRFRADGSLDRSINPSQAYLTLVLSRDKATGTPKNYYTIQVDPLTGMVRTFRP